MTAPKPCIFCGGTQLEIRPVIFRHWNVHCTHCEAKGPTGQTPDQAVNTWNCHHNPSIQKRKDIALNMSEQTKTDKMWKAMRALRTFTVTDVKRISEVDQRETVYKYIYLLEKAGYLRIESQKNAPGAPNVYRCIRTGRIEAPGWTQLRYPEIDEAISRQNIKNLKKVNVTADAR